MHPLKTKFPFDELFLFILTWSCLYVMATVSGARTETMRMAARMVRTSPSKFELGMAPTRMPMAQ